MRFQTFRQFIERLLSTKVFSEPSSPQRRRGRSTVRIEALEQRALLAGNPFVDSIDRLQAQVTSADTVDFKVVFSEAVTGVTADDFVAVGTGTVQATTIDFGTTDNINYFVTVSGITGNGTLGLKLVDNDSIRNLSGLALVDGNLGVSLQAPQTYTTASNAFALAVGDLNGDGRPDLVVAYQYNNNLNILLGNGDGSFATGYGVGSGNTGSSGFAGPDSIAIRDFNSDGFLDLAQVNGDNSILRVYLNNGDATFQNEVEYTTGTAPRAVTAGDVNGDGFADLVVANASSNTVGVFLNNGDGTFGAQAAFATGTSPHGVAIANIDADGLVDLVVVNTGSNDVSLLRGNGDGTFQTPISFAVAGSPTAMRVLDLNGDGMPEVATTSYTGGVVTVLFNGGSGTFSRSDYPVDANPYSISSGDLNGDGIADLVTSSPSQNSITALVTNGEILFGGPQIFSVGNSPTSAKDFDLNGDGRDDVITVNQSTNTVNVQLNAKDGTTTGFHPYTVVQISPYVASISRGEPPTSATNRATVYYNVSFTEDVTGVDASDFTTTTTGSLTVGQVRVIQISASQYRVALSGISGDGTVQLNLVDDNSIRDLSGNALVSSSRSVSYAAPVNHATGSAGRSVATGDFNEDGIADLAGASSASNSITVLLGNGDGTFAIQPDLTTENEPFSVTTGDVNNDGHLDLIVAATSSSTINVFLGNGDGTFQAALSSVAGLQPFSVAVADLNFDDILDVVTGNFDGTFSVLMGTGTGTFLTPVNFASGGATFSIALADFNEDGFLDVFSANFTNGGFSVMTAVGDGTFNTPLGFGSGNAPTSIAVADFDDDGHVDVVVSNGDDDTVSAFFGDGGTFGSAQTLPVGDLPYAVLAKDINGDGLEDIVAANYFSDSLSVFFNNGDGTFTSQGSFSTGPNPRGLTAVDMNGDGRVDIATSNSSGNSVSVLINNATGDRLGEIYAIDRMPPSIQSITRNSPALTNGNSLSYTVSFSENVFGVTEDDFTLVTTGSVTAGAIQVLGTGGSTYTVIITDVIGDGTVALALKYNSSIKDASGNIVAATPTFAPAQVYTSGTVTVFSSLGDLNGDGFDDVVTANLNDASVSVRFNDGAGGFGSETRFSTGLNPRTTALADVNEDGNLDLVVANTGSDSVGVLLGNGNGTFQAQTMLAVGSRPYSVAVADLNGDGFRDIVVTNQASMNVSILLGNGDGTFAPQTTAGTNLGPETVVVADLDGDGVQDLFVGNRGADNLSVLFGNGDGTFLPQVTLLAGRGGQASAVADFNNDGILDLLVSNITDGTVSVLRGLAGREFDFAESTNAGPFPTTAVVADVNGDGTLDIISPNLAAVPSILVGQGDGTFILRVFLTTDGATFAAATSDLNNDGLPDVVSSHNGPDRINVLLNTTATQFTGDAHTIDQTAPNDVSILPTDPVATTTSASTLTFTVVFDEPVVGVTNSAFVVQTTGNVAFANMLVIADSQTQYRVVFSGVTGIGTLQVSLQGDSPVFDLAGNSLNVSGASASYQRTIADIPDSTATSQPIVLTTPQTGQTTTTTVFGTVDTPRDRDFYSFVAQRSGVVEVIQTSDDFGSGLFIYDEVGNLVALDSNIGGQRTATVRFNVETGRMFFIRSAAVGTTTGNYILTINYIVDEISNEFLDAYDISRDLAAGRGNLFLSNDAPSQRTTTIDTAFDTDFLRFVAPVTGQLTVTQVLGRARSGLDSILDAYLEVLQPGGPTGQLITTNDDFQGTDISRVRFNVIAGQAYYIKVYGFGVTSGDWALEFLTDALPTDREGDVSRDAVTVPLQPQENGQAGAGFSGSIDNTGDQDYQQFTAQFSGRATVNLTSALPLIVDAFDINNTRIAHDRTLQNTAQVQFDVVAGQTYFIKVATAIPGTTPPTGLRGQYNLRISVAVADPTPQPGAGVTPEQLRFLYQVLVEAIVQESTRTDRSRQEIAAAINQIIVNAYINMMGGIDQFVSPSELLWTDPVDFIQTDGEGRQAGFTKAEGLVVEYGSRTRYSGDGAVELLIIPNATASSLNVQFQGTGTGSFLAGINLISAANTRGVTIADTLFKGTTSVFLDFGGLANNPNIAGRSAFDNGSIAANVLAASSGGLGAGLSLSSLSSLVAIASLRTLSTVVASGERAGTRIEMPAAGSRPATLLSQGLKSLENLVRRLLEGDAATQSNAAPLATELMEWLLDSVFLPTDAKKAPADKPQPPAPEPGTGSARKPAKTGTEAKNASDPEPQAEPASGAANGSASHTQRRGPTAAPSAVAAAAVTK